MRKYVLILMVLPLLWSGQTLAKGSSRTSKVAKKVTKTEGLVALWDFKEMKGSNREAMGEGNFPLVDVLGTVDRTDEGPISGYSACFDGKSYLSLPYAETGLLNLANKNVTVVAWVKWSGNNNAFVGGMWNEHQDGGKRQYGLFVSLPYYNGESRVCGHISRTGKATPPFPYSIDYSASIQKVPVNEWCCVAFTYDGSYIKSFLNGESIDREKELIDHTVGFEGYPNGVIQSKNPYYFPDGIGDNGSDFTVGAVLLKSGMGNFFVGQIGGLAVFNRALSEKELQKFNLH